MSAQDGGPAFPVHAQCGDEAGMALRDFFAGQALSAMDLQIHIEGPAAGLVARSAYIVADAMLEARKQ